MKQIEQLLRNTMGLDAASIGASMIQRSVRLRMKALNLKEVTDYKKLLGSSTAEWNELIESVVVTESWFYRDRETFAVLVRLVFEEWLPAHPTAPLRLLSLPCSSGEEPYSMAMALQDSGIPAGRFQIDAADISARALERARAGIYRRNSFRGQDLSFRERHFLAERDGFTLSPGLRHGVNFYQGNLLTDDFLAGKGVYDVIFCRNLLIYFDRATQQRALKKIEQLLAPEGLLFVGPAELPLALDQGYVSAAIPMAFACRKAPARMELKPFRQSRPTRMLPTPVRPIEWRAIDSGRSAQVSAETLGTFNPATIVPNSEASSARGRTRPYRATMSLLPGARPAMVGNRIHPGAPSSDDEPAALKILRAGQDLPDATLETARRCADAGLLKGAAEICERHLRENGASANAYYLLGLVFDAQSSPRAIDCYRKALYLQPNHYEALLQMSVLSQRDGDAIRADRFKRRAKQSIQSAGGIAGKNK